MPAITMGFVTSRTALGAQDGLEWDTVAPFGSLCPWDSDRHGVPCKSAHGIDVLITSPGPNVLIVSQQGLDTGSDWAGNFTQGDILLNAVGSALPVVINFSKPVSGAGAQIQPGGIGGPFRGVLTVFRLANSKPVGQAFPFGGVSSNANDGSAVFAGVRSPRADVSRIEFRASDAHNRDLQIAVNALSIRT